MLALFKTNDPAHPEKPAQEMLINERSVVTVEPVYAGGNTEQSIIPTASIITLVDKRKVRVPHTPSAVQRAFKTGQVA